MSLGHLTELAANAILNGGTIPTTYYAQQHTGPPGLAFDENVSPDTRRSAVAFATAADGTTTNTSSSALAGAPSDIGLEYLTLWDNPTAAAGACYWVVPLTGAPVAVVNGNTVTIPAGSVTLTLDIWTQ